LALSGCPATIDALDAAIVFSSRFALDELPGAEVKSKQVVEQLDGVNMANKGDDCAEGTAAGTGQKPAHESLSNANLLRI
jgi:hypothetical protein